MKLTIQKVNNGYIVKLIHSGESAFKALYEPPIHVFESHSALLKYLEEVGL